MEHVGIEVRPVQFWVPYSPDEVSARLDRRLRLAGPSMAGAVHGGHAEFYLPRVRRAAKAAQLVVEMEDADGGTLVRGRFIQHPHVFIVSLVAIVVSGFGGLLALGWGVAQWSMGETPIGLVGLGIFVALGGVAYACCHPRTKDGAEQTDELRQFVEDAVRVSRS